MNAENSDANDDEPDEKVSNKQMKSMLKLLAMIAAFALVTSPFLILGNGNVSKLTTRDIFGVAIGTIAGVGVAAFMLFLGRISQKH